MNDSLTTSHEMGESSLEQLNELLNRYCLSLTHSVWDSEDLVQDTWVKYLDRKQEHVHANPEALLLRTAKNSWIDQHRRKKVFERILNENREQLDNGEKFAQDSSSFDLETAFQQLMKHLSPLQRTVLLLRSVFGYSVADTAKKLQTTEGAVKAAYHRARKELHGLAIDMEDVPISSEDEEAQWKSGAIVRAYINGDVDEVLRLVQGDQGAIYACSAYSIASIRVQMKNKTHQHRYAVTFTKALMAA
ncbi:RNA polymerase sigma factor [Paenibacillus sp. SC116]|uniref:RNA polymerase sigma factor n=1 Tax=Paenibacillus sp. SC116 TaxID=2968986 RepID=UPI00215B231C|nr:RNA polymerase sigma factor [Paenibacillus sp. SC116]MCR8842373.1 RNA polymerase sigma factor [Paenibacillus sp. SC116]